MLRLTACRQMTEVAEADEVMLCKLLLKVATGWIKLPQRHISVTWSFLCVAPESRRQEGGAECQVEERSCAVSSSGDVISFCHSDTNFKCFLLLPRAAGGCAEVFLYLQWPELPLLSEVWSQKRSTIRKWLGLGLGLAIQTLHWTH